jgi:sulfonate transport system substrate-binding protein
MGGAHRQLGLDPPGEEGARPAYGPKPFLDKNRAAMVDFMEDTLRIVRWYHDPGMMPNLAALQANVDLTRELGLVRANLDVKKITDLSIVQEAAARLK